MNSARGLQLRDAKATITATLAPGTVRDSGEAAGSATYPIANGMMTELVEAAAVTYQEPDIAEDEDLAVRCAVTTFLITGPSEADVAAIAQRIHARSLRAGSPFVRASAAVLPSDATSFAEACATLFDAASGGTLLLMNVEEMPMRAQECLLETLAELGARDPLAAVRLIAGTTANLHGCIAKGTFSECLFYRLNIIHIVAGWPSASDECDTTSVHRLLTSSGRPGSPKARRDDQEVSP